MDFHKSQILSWKGGTTGLWFLKKTEFDEWRTKPASALWLQALGKDRSPSQLSFDAEAFAAGRGKTSALVDSSSVFHSISN